MLNLPNITISKTDAQRLTSLLQKVRGSEVAVGLSEELERASVVDAEGLPDAVISINSKVQFKNLKTGKVFEKKLVMPHEVDSSEENISILTPAGAAMLGLTVGNEIEWPLANNTTLQILILGVER